MVMNPKISTSEQQSRVVNPDGLFVVQACPGSGKTFAVAARVASKLKTWDDGRRDGMAVLSFTNVAWKQIHKELTQSFGFERGLRYPHFLGTIDSFVNRYIFLPFGHLVMDSRDRPEMVGEPFGPWRGRNFYEGQFTNLRYTLDGELKLVDAKQVRSGDANALAQVKVAKRRLNSAGFATQTDADYFAMKVLEYYEVVATAVARRFPVIMVDEAQDSSAIQMAILDLLVKHGVKDMILIGDPDQAIFEWRDARPDLLAKKAEQGSWKEKSGRLTNNRRSSQRICEFTWKLTGRNYPPRAVNEDSGIRECTACPEIWGYEGTDFQSLVAKFLSLCRKHAIEPNPESVAVLARSRGLLKQIAGFAAATSEREPWANNITGELLHLKTLADAHKYPEAWKRARRILAVVHLGKADISGVDMRQVEQEHGLVVLRRLAYMLVSALPAASGKLEQWCQAANPKWERFCKSYNPTTSVTILASKQRQEHRDTDVAAALSPDETPQAQAEYRLGTVHSVKGETLEAVLLFLKQKPGSGEHYRTLLANGKTTRESEELRIPYVAMTRPRRVLVLAVPLNDMDAWCTRLGDPKDPNGQSPISETVRDTG